MTLKVTDLFIVHRDRTRVSISFAWYDLWVGAYYDRERHVLYICLIPCLPIRVEFKWVQSFELEGVTIEPENPGIMELGAQGRFEELEELAARNIDDVTLSWEALSDDEIEAIDKVLREREDPDNARN